MSKKKIKQRNFVQMNIKKFDTPTVFEEGLLIVYKLAQ